MAVIEKLVLTSPTEGAAPSLPSGWVNAGSGSAYEVRAAAAMAPDSWGLRLPAMATSFRRLEYTFSDGALTSGTRVWSFGLNPTAFSSVTTAIASFADGTTGKCDIRVNTTGRTLNLRNVANSNANVSGSATYATGTAYDLQFGITIGGNLELRTYLRGSGTLIESISIAATSITQVTKAYMGVTAAAASWAADYSMPIYANDWITASASGTGSLTLSGTGATSAPAAGAGSLSLSATGTATAPGGAAGSGSLSLSGSGAAKATAAGTASLTLTGDGAATAPTTFTFVPKYPVTAAHRGGMPNGEETWEAYDYSLGLVPDVALEYDLTELSDGKFACLHDATVDRTADASSPITTGSASSLTAAQFQSVIMTPQSGGGVVGLGRILDDMASRYTAQLHLPEIKTGSNYTTAISQIISLGLAPHSIVQSFSYTAATAVTAAGLECVYVMASGDTHTFAQMKAAGINHVMRNKTLWTSGDITSAKAAGLRTWIFTVDTTAERDTWLGDGIDGGFISGQPATVHMTGVGSGSLTLSASGGAKAAATGAGSLSLSGSATARATGAGAGSLSLAATGTTSQPAAGAGSLTLAADGAATSPAAGTASLSLSGSGATTSPVVGTAALTLSGAGAGVAPAAGTAALTLASTGIATGPGGATGSGDITITASGGATASTSGTAALTLVGTGAAAVTAAGSGTISLSGTSAGLAVTSGTAAITLSGAGPPGATTGGTGALTLFAAATSQGVAAGLSALLLTGLGEAFGQTVGDGVPVALATLTLTTSSPALTLTTAQPTLTVTTVQPTLTAQLTGAP